MDLVVSSSTQLCFTGVLARAGLSDWRKFGTAPSLYLHSRLCVWPRLLGCWDHLNLDSVTCSISSSQLCGGLRSLPPVFIFSQVIVKKTLDRVWLRIEYCVVSNLSLACHRAIKDGSVHI